MQHKSMAQARVDFMSPPMGFAFSCKWSVTNRISKGSLHKSATAVHPLEKKMGPSVVVIIV